MSRSSESAVSAFVCSSRFSSLCGSSFAHVSAALNAIEHARYAKSCVRACANHVTLQLTDAAQHTVNSIDAMQGFDQLREAWRETMLNSIFGCKMLVSSGRSSCFAPNLRLLLLYRAEKLLFSPLLASLIATRLQSLCYTIRGLFVSTRVFPLGTMGGKTNTPKPNEDAVLTCAEFRQCSNG